MIGPNLPFGGLACGLVLGPLPSLWLLEEVGELDLEDWELCSLTTTSPLPSLLFWLDSWQLCAQNLNI